MELDHAMPASVKRSPAPSILIVEDEAIVALDLQYQLEEMGYAVCGIADNGRDAIDLARTRHPALVLMDIVIKGEMDGIKAAQHIGHELRIPVIFLTAYSDMPTVKRAAETAPYGYLTKPFQLHELRAAIEVALYKVTLERRLYESEQWFAATLRCVADGVVATDEAGKVRFLNPSAEALLGWPLHEALGRDVREVAPVIDKRSGAALDPPALRALQQDAVVGMDYGSLLLARGGTPLPVDDSAAPIRSGDGTALGAVFVFRDVAERLAAEERLKQSEAHFRNVFDFAPVGMALVGLDNRFLQVNGAVCELLDHSEDELVGADQGAFSFVDDLANERAFLEEVRTGQAVSAQFEKRYRTRRGGVVWTLVSVSLLRQQNEPLCYLWQIHDLTERKNVEDRLAHLAHFDPLTGLANRAWLNEEIERQIALARRHQQRFAVVFLDLDHFKQVNDSLGHEAGDQLLQAIAHKLKSSIRQVDTAARLGGDEFVLLLPEIRQAEDVLTVTEKLRAECAQPIVIDGHEMSVGISLGACLYPDDAEDARTLLRYADSALYHAKAEGRNNLQFYRPELMARVQQRMRLEAGLRLAVQRGELELYYQPIVSLADGHPVKAEALLRWNHPSLGLLTPDTFVPLAEEMGLSEPVGEWVIDAACHTAADWPPYGSKSIGVSINVSPCQFKSSKLVECVSTALVGSGLDPVRLCVEITEQALLDNSEKNQRIIAALKSLGVRIVLDDFGVGYSSLGYISRIVPAEIKIDGSLVRDIAVNPYDAALVKATITMAHSLDMLVVTEGVETAAQRDLLRGEHCDMAQGFLYARPLPAAEFKDWLRRFHH
jgi:diguanylate cyclase (GGDEF)-like protein/PAS domain S-box-containing protein